MSEAMKLKPDAVYIELTPKVFDDENVWTGEITVNIIMDKNSSLDKR